MQTKEHANLFVSSSLLDSSRFVLYIATTKLSEGFASLLVGDDNNQVNRHRPVDHNGEGALVFVVVCLLPQLKTGSKSGKPIKPHKTKSKTKANTSQPLPFNPKKSTTTTTAKMATIEERIKVFNDTKVWNKLPHECIEEVAEVMILEDVNDGHIFVREGERKFLFFLKK
jgi:hypothetical protein